MQEKHNKKTRVTCIKSSSRSYEKRSLLVTSIIHGMGIVNIYVAHQAAIEHLEVGYLWSVY